MALDRRIITLLSMVIIISVILSIACEKSGDDGQPSADRLRSLPQTAEILFLSNQGTGEARWEIYSANAQGGDVTRITTTNDQHHIFGIDSSGRYIVATRGPDAKKQLWLLDLQTGIETALTDAESHAEGRSISPDGEWIVFWMIPGGKQYSDIYKIRLDGSDLTNLTNTPLAHEFDPCWSNSGNEIAYVFDDGDPHRFMLQVMDSDSSDIQVLYDPVDAVNTPLFPAGVYDPSWSPDDQWILVEKPVKFTGKGENGTGGIWHILKIKSDGSEVIDLSEAGGHAEWTEYLPSFSPDGNTIIFSARYGPSDPSGVSLNIFKMDIDGGSLEKVTDTSFWEQLPVWIY